MNNLPNNAKNNENTQIDVNFMMEIYLDHTRKCISKDIVGLKCIITNTLAPILLLIYKLNSDDG